MTNTIELTPSKETYNAIRADVGVAASFKELIDNAIDNAIREGKSVVQVEIVHKESESGPEEIIVRDDSGGIHPNELDMLFALGESRKEDIRGSIGAFGIGAKKALMRLGRSFDVISRHEDREKGWGYTIDESWIEEETEWEVELTEYDLQPETTELRVRNLNFDWNDKLESLRNTLRETYQMYTDDSPYRDTEVKLELYLDEEKLTPPGNVEYSYTPWGDLYPRKFEGIMITPPDIDATVEMRITAGLMAVGDESEAGTDVFCQNRLVVHAGRGANGGFDVPRGLPKFRPEAHKRLKIRVEFLTEGDAADLPWNADKSRIRTDHPVMRKAREWIREVGDRYMQARYGDVPTPFHTPYTRDSEYAANGGEIAGPFDYTSHFRELMQGKRSDVEITERPRASLSKISKMQETAQAHAKLGIKCERVGWFEDWMLPTYYELVEEEIENTPFETLTPIDVEIPDVTQVSSIDGLIEEIESLAEDHFHHGVISTDVEPYEEVRYRLVLNRLASEHERSVEDLEQRSDPDLEEFAEDAGTGRTGQATETGGEMAEGTDREGATMVWGQERDEQSKNPTYDDTTLTFGPFEESELVVMERHLGNVSSLSPEERREVLLEYLKALDDIGIDPQAIWNNRKK